MADWRDIVAVPASFRGVEFFVDGSRYKGGRRAVPHEVPFSENPPFVEDEGKSRRTFTLEGFVVGNDYVSKRDALLTALETKGPGTLVHPFYGTRTVQVGDDLTVDEKKDEGGCARFSITFHETLPLPASPTISANASTAVLASAANARSAAVGVFNAANAAVSSVRNAVSGALTSLSNTIGTLAATASLGPQAAALLVSQLVSIRNNAVALAASPADLVTSVIGIYDTLKAAVDSSNITDPWGFFLGIYSGFDPGARPTGTTPNNVLAQANFDATVRLIQAAAIVGAAEEAAAQAFESSDAAIVARGAILDAIDAFNEAASDDTYPYFAQLASDLVKALPGESLPKLLSITPVAVVPSLVLAHRIYTANPSTFPTLADAETDLVTRNRIPNPGFVPGGVPLTVLSDA